MELRLRGVPHEIIVVDDGSTDRTWEILQSEAARLNATGNLPQQAQEAQIKEIKTSSSSCPLNPVPLVADSVPKNSSSNIQNPKFKIAPPAQTALQSAKCQQERTDPFLLEHQF